MSRLRKALIILTAAGAATISLVTIAQVAAQASASKGEVVVVGRVTWHHHPVKGAKVVLFAEPPPTILTRVKRYQTVPWKVIGQGKTNSKGRYSIVVSGAGLRQADAYSFSKKHVVNLEVAAFFKPKGAAHWFSRLYLRGHLSATRGESAVPAVGTAAMAPTVVNLSLAVPDIPASVMKAAEQANPDAFKPGNPYYCLEHIYTRDLGAQSTVVGSTYSNMANVSMGFTYGYGQNSSLGVAISVIPPQGFKYSGALGLDMVSAGWSDSVSSNIGIPYEGHSGYDNTKYLTKFTYRLYLEPCNGLSVEPTGFAGGSSEQNGIPGFPSENKWCEHYGATPPNDPIALNDSTAYQFSAGVNISYWLGINLSSQTGYDSNAAATYELPKGGYLCGTTGYAGTNDEGLVYAGKYNHSPGARGTRRRAS
jgi:hypothetical protein